MAIDESKSRENQGFPYLHHHVYEVKTNHITVISEIFVRILFSRIVLKDIQSYFDGSNSSGPSVRVRPIHVFLTIFMLVHVYFTSSQTPRFLSTNLAKRT